MDQRSYLHNQWLSAWAALNLQPPAGLYEQLLHAYAQPQRHYHTLQHLSECLSWLDKALHTAKRPGEVAIALWFHDAIYDVRGSSNEQQSTNWAMRALQAAGATAEMQQRVLALILATQHHAEPAAGDAQLLVDIDLAILGASPARLAQYTQQIRQEYAWVPEALFQNRRRAVLQGFVQRPRIYSTPYFHDLLEAQARLNLSAAIQSLAPTP